MKSAFRPVVVVALIVAFLSTGLPCGPGYISPLFDTTSAPETPYTEFAAGRLGIVKSTFRRSVLLAAYRHIAGGGLNTFEQKAMVEVWRAEIDNKDFRDNSVDEAVKAWVEKRKEAVGKEEKPPDIYTERSYGGYDFFPNCTKNAFEIAAETLGERITSHGATDQNVLNWVRGQDQVFQNCTSGKQTPDAVTVGAPLWLQKDRDYQTAAAEFYSLAYSDAKKRFADIALDTESPWRETADYLVARTLIRQASLSKTVESARPFYEEAEEHLDRLIAGSPKFSASAERLMGLVKYRLRPRERTSELAKNITIYGGNESFRQDVIDYNWLLDKFETEVLNAEEKRKETEKTVETPGTVANMAVVPANRSPQNDAEIAVQRDVNAAIANVRRQVDTVTSSNTVQDDARKSDDNLEIYVYSVNSGTSWRLFVRSNATDADALAEAERVIGRPLTDEMKTQVRDGRQQAYSNRFTENTKSNYEGGYFGDVKLKPSLIPDFLRQDEITAWLYAYQLSGAEAYLYSLKKFIERSSDLWLMTALSQAEKSSTQLPRLIEAAEKANRSSAAYPTIAFHTARILLAQNKHADARKLIDEMLGLGDTLPLSARNSFTGLRLKLAETLEDFLRYSLKKPYAFDFSGDVGTIDEIIAEQKSYYNPEYNKDGRDAYGTEIEENYREEKLWQDRAMFDAVTIDVLNQHFSNASLLDVYKSTALPEYMRPRLAIAIWTRAYLLNDAATLAKLTPELAKHVPDLQPQLEKIAAAKSPAARENALLFLVAKNPILSPYIEDGIGRTDNDAEQWDSDDWWCEPYDNEYRDESNSEVPKRLPPRPAFLTPAQSRTAQNERKRLKATGDAPKYLGSQVMRWAKRSPADRRVPELLYMMVVANGWNKYGCGNNEAIRDEAAKFLKTRYPDDEWTAKMLADESDK